MLDRIDIHIEVPAAKFKDLAGERSGETSEVIRKRVKKARDIQITSFKSYKNLFGNARMESKEIRQYCEIDERSQELLKMAITKPGLSARAYDRILKVSEALRI